MRGAPKAAQGHHHAHTQSRSAHETRQTNKILELEWEALGRKLNKPVGKENSDVEKLRMQLKDREEQLKYAESVIEKLKAELRALQQKQGNSQQNQNKQKKNQQMRNQQKQNQQKQAKYQGQKGPAGRPEFQKKPQQQYQRPQQNKLQSKGRK